MNDRGCIERSSNDEAGRRWVTSVVLLGLIVVSFGLRIWRIEAKSIWWDESLSLYRAQHDLPYVLSNRIDFPGAETTDLHPPLYFVLLHFFIRLAGESDLALRFPSVCWATALVPLLYIVGKRWWGRGVGLWAAGLGAVSPFYLWYAQEARMYTMVTCLGLLSAYVLGRALEGGRRSWYITFVILAAAMLYTHYFAFLLLAFEGLAWLLGTLRNRRWRSIWVFALVGAMCLPLLGYAVYRLASGPEMGRVYVPLFSILGDSLNSFALGLSVRMWQVYPLDLLFLVMYVLGVWSSSADHEWQGTQRRFFLLGYVFVPILGLYLSSLVKPFYMGSRYVIIASPGFYLGVAAGLNFLLHHRGRFVAVLSVLCSLLLFAGIGYSTYNYFFDEHYGTKEDHRSSARYVEAHGRPGDLVVVDAPENMPAFRHYYGGELPAIGLPGVAMSGRSDPVSISRDLEQEAGDYRRIWLVQCRTMFSDPDELVHRWLEEHTFKLDEVNFRSYGSDAQVYLYQPESPVTDQLPAMQCSEIAEFGGELTLLGYDLPSMPLAVHESAVMTLYWRAKTESSAEYKVSLQLVDDEGTLWAQRDRVPFYFFPTTLWPVGQIIRQEHELTIPPGTPPGEYRLELRVYGRESGDLLPVTVEPCVSSETTVLTLAEVVVARPTKSVSAEGLVLAHRTDATYGGRLRLLGYNISRRKAYPGERLKLDLHWLALRNMDGDYGLDLWLLDERGRLAGELKSWPSRPAYPTSQWHPGEIVRGQPTLELPVALEPGEYRLRLLVRDPGTGWALPFWRSGFPWSEVGLDLGSIDVREPK
ncbi:MAG: glycosyltransferase family 39 protein [Chloroflexota bacterium]